MVLFLPLVLVVGALIALLAGRAEDDPGRERPRALYLALVTLVATLGFLASVGAIARGVTELTDDDRAVRVYRFDSDPAFPRELLRDPNFRGPADAQRPRFIGGDFPVNHDDDVSLIVIGLIAGVLAAGVAKFHGAKLRELAANDGPGARIAAREAYLLCGATLLATLAAAATGAYAFYGLIAPDTAGVGTRADALRTMIGATIVGITALALFARNWSRADTPPPAATTTVVIVDEPQPPAPQPPASPKSRVTKKAAPPTT